jgi:ATP-binding cassette subfamily B (MDR/TAP) protein 7
MLLRAARSPCWRTAQFAYPSFASRPRSTRLNGAQLRLFTSNNNSLRSQPTDNKDRVSVGPGAAPTTAPSQLATANIVKPEDSGNAKTPPKKDLLSEPADSKKEQRKADWAIMKEMAKYLWPKVIPEYRYGVNWVLTGW